MKWKQIAAKLFVIPLLGVMAILSLSGFYINGAAPGSSASMTPAAVGSTTPVAVATCSNSAITGRTAIEFSNISTTANCYLAPANESSPCAAASPAPNSSTKAGEWIGPGQKWTFSFSGPGSPWGGKATIQSEWDAVCDAASSIGHTDLP